MPYAVLPLIAACLVLAACGGREPPPVSSVTTTSTLTPGRVVHVACDDGGSGGSLIDGVCF